MNGIARDVAGDMLVIGGGVAGLTAALVLAWAQHGVTVHDELPPIDGLDERWGTSVFNCPFCDGWEHRDQHVVVIDAAPGATTSRRLSGRGRRTSPSSAQPKSGRSSVMGSRSATWRFATGA